MQVQVPQCVSEESSLLRPDAVMIHLIRTYIAILTKSKHFWMEPDPGSSFPIVRRDSKPNGQMIRGYMLAGLTEQACVF